MSALEAHVEQLSGLEGVAVEMVATELALLNRMVHAAVSDWGAPVESSGNPSSKHRG